MRPTNDVIDATREHLRDALASQQPYPAHPARSRKLVFTLLAGAILSPSLASDAHASAPPDLAVVQQKLSAMAIPFVPNAGQWDSRAAFAAQTFAGTLFVTTEGQLVYSLPPKREACMSTSPSGTSSQSAGRNAVAVSTNGRDVPTAHRGRDANAARVREIHSDCPEPSPARSGTLSHWERGKTTGWVLTETLVDAKGQPRKLTHTAQKKARGELPTEGKVSYAIGGDSAKHANALTSYERVNLGEMYPGVNVHLRATGKNVEKIFTVAPQQNPSQIRIELDGAERLEIGNEGELIAHTGNGPVSFTKPIAFQENERGERVSVAVAYHLVGADTKSVGADQTALRRPVGADLAALPGAPPSDAKSSPTTWSDADPHLREESPTGETTAVTYGFTLGDYDASRPLVIDPLLQSTYLGGSAVDEAYALVIHPSTGEIYVAGSSYSSDLPGVAGGAQTVHAGDQDAFIARFNSALTTRLQTTYFGGAVGDVAQGLAIHPATGEVYISGFSNSANLPGVAGGAQNAAAGGQDAFVARFNAALTARLQSTYLGGTGDDIGLGLAIHPTTGEVYVAGFSTSSNFPGVAGSAQAVNSGGQDAFIARLNPALTTLVRSTYLGGTGNEIAQALAIHPATGEIYVAGATFSTNLPGVAGGAQPVQAGSQDAFIARFNPALTTRLQSTYLGGTDIDEARTLAIHPWTGEVYVAGYTTSANFPGVAGGAQSTASSGDEAFIARFNAALTSRLQSTYLGGAGIDRANALAMRPATGEVYVAGFTDSTDLAGVTGGTQSSKSGGTYDAFVARFNAALTSRMQSTYFGGAGNDLARALAVHPATGEVYVAGGSSSANLPGVAGGAQSIYSGSTDAFVSRQSGDLTAVNRIPNPFSFIHQSNVPPNTMRTSNEVQLIITPTPPNNQQSAYVTGAVGSELCIATQPGVCVTPYVGCAPPCFSTGWFPGPWDFLSGDYIAVRHTSANPGGTAETTLIISGTAYPFRSSTGNANIACNLDMNGDNTLSATLEGLILVRAMLGLGADAIIVGTGIPAWNPVRERLNQFCGTNFPFSPSAFQ